MILRNSFCYRSSSVTTIALFKFISLGTSEVKAPLVTLPALSPAEQLTFRPKDARLDRAFRLDNTTP